MKIPSIAEYVKTQLNAGARPQLFTKSAPVRARPGVIGETVVTKMSDGHIETAHTISSLDKFVVTNPGGEEYVIDGNQLDRRYMDAGPDGLRQPRPVPQEMIFTSVDLEFTASWGEPMRIRAGGALNITGRATGYIYGIQPDEFSDTYAKYKSPIYESLAQMAANARVISFDVFDTLLLRINPDTGAVLTDPDEMFYLIEDKYNIPGFADARLAAESAVRRGRDTDMTFNRIYKKMPSHFRPAQQLETQWELQNCIPNLEMTDAFHRLTAKKIITSDMYLNSATIAAMLDGIGISLRDYSRLYVSSDMRKTKAGGRLYNAIVRDLNIRPSDILHVGDNARSDFNIAKQMGLNAMLYRKAR